MHSRRTALRIAGVVIVLMALAILSAALYHFRPLFPSRAYKATVEVPGTDKGSAAVYTMLGRPSWIFIRVPKTHLDCERPSNRWFLLDTQKDSVSWTSANESPYLHRNHDQSRGINLLDAKMEDNWRIERQQSSIRFTNDRQTVTVVPSTP
jgi:hypothetical protein